MSHIKWSKDLETGIEVIDHQHRRIVDNINQLQGAISRGRLDEINEIFKQLKDYTKSHFTFEEDLLRKSGYDDLLEHQETHHSFAKILNNYHQSFNRGEDISQQLLQLLRTWLVEHIKTEKIAYLETVTSYLEQSTSTPEVTRGFFARLFRK